MKRISKREMRNRFGLIGEARVRIESLKNRGAHVLIDGIECDLGFPKDARWEIARPEGIAARVMDYPAPGNSGQFPRGTRPEQVFLPQVLRHMQRPRLAATGRLDNSLSERLSAFEARYPVGSLVSARVLRQTRDGVLVELPLGLRGRLPQGYCLDHIPGEKVRWLALPQEGRLIEVVIRRMEPWRGGVLVSLHSYRRDSRYCACEAGYRGSYRIEGSSFRRLPWDEEESSNRVETR